MSTTEFTTHNEFYDAIAEATGNAFNDLPADVRKFLYGKRLEDLGFIFLLQQLVPRQVRLVVPAEAQGEDAAKLQHIEEAARKSHGKLADTILAIIESDSFAEDPDNLVEDNDAAD